MDDPQIGPDMGELTPEEIAALIESGHLNTGDPRSLVEMNLTPNEVQHIIQYYDNNDERMPGFKGESPFMGIGKFGQAANVGLGAWDKVKDFFHKGAAKHGEKTGKAVGAVAGKVVGHPIAGYNMGGGVGRKVSQWGEKNMAAKAEAEAMKDFPAHPSFSTGQMKGVQSEPVEGQVFKKPTSIKRPKDGWPAKGDPPPGQRLHADRFPDPEHMDPSKLSPEEFRRFMAESTGNDPNVLAKMRNELKGYPKASLKKPSKVNLKSEFLPGQKKGMSPKAFKEAGDNAWNDAIDIESTRKKVSAALDNARKRK